MALLIHDLPVKTRRLAEGIGSAGGKLPSGARQGPNDFGSRDYGGLCPPARDRPHRYHVTLWALKVSSLLPAPVSASAALIDYLIEANAIAHRTVSVRYSR